VNPTTLGAQRRPILSGRRRTRGRAYRVLWDHRALSSDLGLDQPLTHLERLALAVASCEPTHFLTLNSPWSDYGTFTGAWCKWHARIRRELGHRGSPPLIYLARIARAKNSGTYHSHLILWGYLHASMLHGHARELALGPTHIEQIHPTWGDRLNLVTYVLGQTESVLGRSQARRHFPREMGVPRYQRPRDKTLATHAPLLLVALNAAKDHTVTDADLCEYLSTFISA
jgi:hypothetical protein